MNEIYVCCGEEFNEFSCVAVVEKMTEKDVIFKRFIAYGKLLMQGRRSFLVFPKAMFFEYYHKATESEMSEIERRGYLLHGEIH